MYNKEDKKKKKLNIFTPIQILFSRRTIITLLILIQFAFIVYLAFSGSALSVALNIVALIFGILFSLYVITTDRAPGYKLLWVFLFLALPLLGILLYLVLVGQGSTKSLKKRQIAIDKKASGLMLCSGECGAELYDEIGIGGRCAEYLMNVGSFPVYKHTNVEYFPLGDDAFPAMLRELEAAEKYIFIEYFIISEGEMWDAIFDILKRKAANGVCVRVILDDIGCFALHPRKLRDQMKRAGIECFIFNPFRPFITSVQNNRDHRKILSIDGKVVFTGGINISDEYINRVVRFGHWKDCAIMLRGDAAWSFTVMFLAMWNGATERAKAEDMRAFLPEFEKPESDGYVAPYCDSPLDNENVCERVYVDIISRARKYLYIYTPYLIIDEVMANALTLAAKSGVDVRIVTPGIADKKLVHATTRSFYKTLLNAGVRIYEYQPGFIHSKMVISDDNCAAVGSANLDYRSMYLSFECSAWIYQNSEIAKMKADFEETLTKSREFKADEMRDNLFTLLYREVLHLLSPLM